MGSIEADWDAGLQRALADPPGTWVLQERILRDAKCSRTSTSRAG